MPIAHCAHLICFWMSVDHLYVQNSTGTLFLSSSLALLNHQAHLALLLLHRIIGHVQHLPLGPSHPFLQPPTLVANLSSPLASIKISAIRMNDIGRPSKENVRRRNTMNATKSGMASYFFGNAPRAQLPRVQVLEPSHLPVSRLRKVRGPEVERRRHRVIRGVEAL